MTLGKNWIYRKARSTVPGRTPCASASRRSPARKLLKSLSAPIARPPPSGKANSGAAASKARRRGRKGIIDMPPLLFFPRICLSRRRLIFQYSRRRSSERRRSECQVSARHDSERHDSEREGTRQPQRYRRDVGDRHQYEKHDAIERPNLTHDVFHADAAHG